MLTNYWLSQEMNRAFYILTFLLSFTLSGVYAQQHPVVNEVVTANITGIPDEYDIVPYNCPVPDCEQWYADLGMSIFDGSYPGWVELYNPGESDIHMDEYCLSDDPINIIKWTFPDIILPSKSHLLVFLSGKDRKVSSPPNYYLHTNFKLKRIAEGLYFSTISGTIVDDVDASDINRDFSLGRVVDGADEWTTFISPTPLGTNQGEQFSGYTDQISASQAPGAYNSSLSLELSVSTSGAEIRYTTDGGNPGPGSDLYSTKINIGDPTTIKARAFKDGQFISPVFTGSYIIGDHDLQ
jgi:hypothetical protein